MRYIGGRSEVVWSHLFSSPARLSLTPEHLMPLLQGVRNWWKGGEHNDGVLGRLGVPEFKRQEILQHFGSKEDEAVKKCIEWWVEHAIDVCWRKIIYSLDEGMETKVADGLKQYAEPLSGITIQCVICRVPTPTHMPSLITVVL